jgi:hypothetical protein
MTIRFRSRWKCPVPGPAVLLQRIPIKFGVTPVPGLGMEAVIFVGLALMIAGVVFQGRRAKA